MYSFKTSWTNVLVPLQKYILLNTSSKNKQELSILSSLRYGWKDRGSMELIRIHNENFISSA